MRVIQSVSHSFFNLFLRVDSEIQYHFLKSLKGVIFASLDLINKSGVQFTNFMTVKTETSEDFSLSKFPSIRTNLNFKNRGTY